MKILEPIKLKEVPLKSRVVLAPMVPFGIKEGPEYSLGEEVLEYYRKRIHGDLGLVITNCISVISHDVGLRNFGIGNSSQKADLKKLIDMTHANGTKILVQLGYPSKGHHRHEKITQWTISQLEQIREEFVEAARTAKELGADGVELHGANMFFLNMFSSPITNTRTDRYGGDVKGRLCLAKEILEEIKTFSDDTFLISYRMGWNQDLKTDLETAKELERSGIDLLHISYGIREADRKMPEEYPDVICYPGSSREKLYSTEEYPYNDVVYTGEKIQKELKIPVILVDEIWTLERGNELLKKGAGTLIAYGRPFLADPDFLEKSEADPSYQGCYKCKECAWFSDYSKCPRVIQRKAR